MTERIETLRRLQWERAHHAARIPAPKGPFAFRDRTLPDFARTAARLEEALALEKPHLFPGELIALTRTVPGLPRIYDEDEWAAICEKHYIHELGNVCNLSPGYEGVIASGLLSLRERLGDGAYHAAMRRNIDAVIDLTARYRAAAERAGDTELAGVLARVPMYGAAGFREALQSLRILHFAMWCEGDYHNTLGRFDQYMLPYLRRDLASGALTRDQAFELLEAFFLSCNRDSDLYPGMQQGDNGQSMVLGGTTRDGAPAWNELSEMCLRASEELMLIDPKINVRVRKDTPISVYEMGTRLTRLGLGFPQYENDDVAIPGLEALGYAAEDARDYAMAACWEFIIPGKGMDVSSARSLLSSHQRLKGISVQ